MTTIIASIAPLMAVEGMSLLCATAKPGMRTTTNVPIHPNPDRTLLPILCWNFLLFVIESPSKQPNLKSMLRLMVKEVKRNLVV
jgi:hypothetical protein